MAGCKRRRAESSTNTRLRCVCRRATGSAPSRRLAFENSMYQSQNSFQKNACRSLATSPNLYSEMPWVTRSERPAKRDKIHASAGVAATGSPGVKPSRLPSTKRLAFQIFVTKARACSVRGEEMSSWVLGSMSASKRTSWLFVTSVSKLKRMASAPYFAMRSMGSTPLPFDLDMRLPSFAKMVA